MSYVNDKFSKNRLNVELWIIVSEFSLEKQYKCTTYVYSIFEIIQNRFGFFYMS